MEELVCLGAAMRKDVEKGIVQVATDRSESLLTQVEPEAFLAIFKYVKLVK